MISKKLFREIRVSFLMKGHTHEDIDRLFRLIKMNIETRGARTLPELVQCVADAVKQCDVQIVQQVRVFT